MYFLHSYRIIMEYIKNMNEVQIVVLAVWGLELYAGKARIVLGNKTKNPFEKFWPIAMIFGH